MTTPFQIVDAVTIRRTLVSPVRTVQPAVSRMVISPADTVGLELRVPYSPNEVEHSNIGSDFAEVNRAGRKNSLVYIKKQLNKMSFTLYVADKAPIVANKYLPQGFQHTSFVLKQLRLWAENGTRLKVLYGLFESGIWNITSCSVQTVRRARSNNEPIEANVELEFTKVQDIVAGVGPVSGGVRPPTGGSPSVKPKVVSSAPKTRTYVVKRGDTLWGISIKYYGTGTKWRTIADYNKIKDPKKLQIGKTLRIP